MRSTVMRRHPRRRRPPTPPRRRPLPGITTAAPIWDWSDRDVYAAHAAFDLPLNPVYDRLRRLGAPRQAWRVDAAVSGARGLDQGRIEWLRRGWPDLYRRLEQALPRLKEF